MLFRSLARAAWIPDYHRTRGPHVDPAGLAAEGLLHTARVEGWRDPVYIHPEHLALAQQAAAGALTANVTTLLSPFDPVVWDRRRARELFGFDYRLECYTPAPKRRYGYFTLPLLRRGALVGRVDAKAHRKQGIFELRSVALEPGVRLSARLASDIAGAVLRCARWHDCPRVTVSASDPPAFGSMLAACW